MDCGSTPGVIAGAFVVAFIPEYLRQAAGGDSLLNFLNDVTGSSASDITEYRFFLFGIALILMMVFRPQGLLPNRQRAAELTEAPSAGRSLGERCPVDQTPLLPNRAVNRKRLTSRTRRYPPPSRSPRTP